MTPVRRLLLPLAATALALAGPAVAMTTAHAEEAPSLTIEALGLATDSGGYPSINFGLYGLSARFGDATAEPTHRYTATATEVGGEGVVVEADVDVWEDWDGSYPLNAYLPNDGAMQVGDTFEVVVREWDGDQLVEESAPSSVTIAVVDHPSSLRFTTSGKRSVGPGELVKLRWKGEYGEGTKVTQVIAARRGGTFSEDPADFLVCQNSYCPTAKGTKYVSTRSRVLTSRFRVPERFAGATLEIVVYGQAPYVDGVGTAAPWGWHYTLKVRRS